MNDYEKAMASQGACNLVAILGSMQEMARKYPAKHPILRMYSEQVLHLTGGGCGDAETYARAYNDVSDRLNPTAGGECWPFTVGRKWGDILTFKVALSTKEDMDSYEEFMRGVRKDYAPNGFWEYDEDQKPLQRECDITGEEGPCIVVYWRAT